MEEGNKGEGGKKNAGKENRRKGRVKGWSVVGREGKS